MTKFLRAILVSICAISAQAFAASLGDAVNLYNSRDYEGAHLLLQQIMTESTSNTQAQYYDALCLQGLGKHREFRLAVEGLRAIPGDLSADQKEKLDREYIVVSYQTRAFAAAREFSRDYKTSYAQSQFDDQIRMIHLLASFEQGYKKAWEAKNWGLGEAPELKELSAKNWNNGTQFLREFLDNRNVLENLVAEHGSDLSTKSQSLLFENIWKARIILGDEAQLLEEIQQAPPEIREYFQSVRTQTHFEFFPDDLENSIAILTAFESVYPNSTWAVNLKCAILKSCFRQGRFLYENGRLAGLAGKTDQAIINKQKGTIQLALYRNIVDSGVLERQAGLPDKDLDEILNNYLYSLILEGNYDMLAIKSKAMADSRPVGSRMWGDFKIYEAQSYTLRYPPDYERAAHILDEVIAQNIVDEKRNVHIPTLALEWRIYVARRMNDHDALEKSFDKLRNEMPETRARELILRTFTKSTR